MGLAHARIQSPVERRGIAPVTVVIATRNRSAFIGDALQSCLNQVLRPQHVIVVDDGSTDDTSEVVGRFRALASTYVNVGRIGLGNARNLATALCRTEYICILDDDDIMLPNRIGDHMAALVDGAQLSHGGWINFNSRLELEYRPGKLVDEDVVAYVGAALTHGACCYRTAVLREFPYRSDAVGGADFDLALRVVRSGIRSRHTGSYVLLRRRHEASLSATHGATQDSMRRVVVGALNMRRSDAEITRRTHAGNQQPEILTARSPPLHQILSMLAGPREAMYVVGEIPRSADEAFALLRRLDLDWRNLTLLDSRALTTATIGLSSLPTARLSVLSAVEAAFRRNSIRPTVRASTGTTPKRTLREMSDGLPPDSFRIMLRSNDLKELYLAHAIIRNQRPWKWYLAAPPECSSSQSDAAYCLVSAPFRKTDETTAQRRYADEVCRFVKQQTDLDGEVVEGIDPI